MILYLEEQLEAAYKKYCKHQAKQDMSFMSLDDFRNMFEDLMAVVYQDSDVTE